ncbi:hypothetical protein [Actinophytocola xanthii]|uniref:DUF1524 domain-containing protein n=1 Tax=Actinophytocola xanthii TaxID=1912961 RepID=A0A1Q8CPE1_9PSEU|nr:hypothetical protein [Actinophytocola xanthii]OLF16223.1 hypothetical protein BU204_17795 [Actinophytocola xanthii]
MTRIAAGLVAAALVLTACDPLELAAPSTPPPAPPAQPPPANAAALLGKLVVAEEDTGAHYKREHWGEGWSEDRNGCSTRELVLLEQARAAEPGRNCAPDCPSADQSCWVSPYDGRPTGDARDLEIDHRVSLKEASRSRVVQAGGKPGLGAARLWSPERKHAFYEDRSNLVAVTSQVNQSKSDDDAGDWRPAQRAAWCDFATRYAQTKVKYGLTVDRAEHAGLAQMLGTCPK